MGIGMTDILQQTTDMETEAGLIYLLHDNEQQIRNDCNLLHKLELKYPDILYQGSSDVVPAARADRDLDSVVECGCSNGTTLIFSDTIDSYDGAEVVTTETLASACDKSFDQGVLDLSDASSYLDLESIVQQIFVFMDKIRVGGKILIPESTYCHLPYGIEGMEILLRVSGMIIELPVADVPGLLIATIL